MNISDEIIETAKHWANQLLVSPPQRPVYLNYPRDSAARVEDYSRIARGLVSYLQLNTALALLDFIVQEATAAQEEYDPGYEDEFRGWQLVNDAFLDLINTHLQIEAYDEALSVTRLIHDERIRVEGFAEVATALFQNGHHEAAAEVFAEAENVANAVEKKYRKEAALSTLLQPAMQIKGSDYAVALSGSINHQGSGIRECFQDLIQQMIDVGLLSHAQKVALNLTNRVERARGLSRVAVALADAGMPDQSKRILGELEELLTSTDELSTDQLKRQLYFLSFLAVAFFKTGDPQRSEDLFARASQIAQEYAATEGVPSPLCAYPVALAECGHFGKARAAAQAIPTEHVRCEALGDLALFFVEISEFSEARTIASLTTDGFWHIRIRIVDRLVETILTDGDVKQVAELLEEIGSSAFRRPYGYAVSRMLAHLHRIPEAIQYLAVVGIDVYLKNLAHFSSEFERIEKGLARRVMTSALEIAAQKHPDYEAILKLIS